MEFPDGKIFKFIWLLWDPLGMWGLLWDREQDGETQGLGESKAELRCGRVARGWGLTSPRGGLGQRQKEKSGWQGRIG